MWKTYQFWFKTGSVLLIVTGVAGVLGFFWDLQLVSDSGTDFYSYLDQQVSDFIGVKQSLSQVYIVLGVGVGLLTIFIGIQNLFIIRAPIAPQAHGWFMGANLIIWVLLTQALVFFSFLLPMLFYGVCTICFIIAYILQRRSKTQFPGNAHYTNN